MMTDDAAGPTTETAPTRAREVMTTNVVAVTPATTVREIARLLLEHRISAVPVVDELGAPIGMVSEGDLIGRDEKDRLARRDWWLALLTGSRRFDEAFQDEVTAEKRTAADLMTAPLVTVTEETGVDEVARLLTIHHVKRVPVVRDGKMTGIVSRADLVRALAAGATRPEAAPKTNPGGFLVNLFGEYHRPAWQVIPPREPAPAAPKSDDDRIAAETFRHLVDDFHGGESRHRDAARRAAAEQRGRRAKELIDAHVTDEEWRRILQRARVAAENGATEYLLLRFPNELCLDGGRAINAALGTWPTTLRGEAAEIYLRWERELKPRDFGLSARVLEFPDGKPGDIGLFLTWPD
jgi:CBS domain-containing protein